MKITSIAWLAPVFASLVVAPVLAARCSQTADAAEVGARLEYIFSVVYTDRGGIQHETVTRQVMYLSPVGDEIINHYDFNGKLLSREFLSKTRHEDVLIRYESRTADISQVVGRANWHNWAGGFSLHAHRPGVSQALPIGKRTIQGLPCTGESGKTSTSATEVWWCSLNGYPHKVLGDITFKTIGRLTVTNTMRLVRATLSPFPASEMRIPAGFSVVRTKSIP